MGEPHAVFLAYRFLSRYPSPVGLGGAPVWMYSLSMLVRLHRLRDRGWPIPRYQFAFKKTVLGELTVHEERDPVLNRHTRVARLRDPETGTLLADVPPLLDAQLVALTREVLSLSGIERIAEPCVLRIEDFAQTWLCWLDAKDSPGI